MSDKKQEELRQKAKETSDETVKQKIEQVKTVDEANEFLNNQRREIEQQEALTRSQQQESPRPKPQWISPTIKAVLKLVGFDSKKFNEKNFVASLKKMGISSLITHNNDIKLQYGNNKSIVLDSQQGLITSNDTSEQGFSNVAKFARASGGLPMDMSAFIKQQQQTKNPNLDHVLTTAYKAAKVEGIALAGMEAKGELMGKLEHKTPTLKPPSSLK